MQSGLPLTLLLLCAVSAPEAAFADPRTDFGIRIVGQIPAGDGRLVEPAASASLPLRGPVDLASAARIGAQWGTVTSTRRSIAHNRAVGGVRNSYHLSGRAIDIARRPGVHHADIAAAFRRAGFTLIESLDEGDHSHFAFGGGTTVYRQASVRGREGAVQSASVSRESERSWRIVTAPAHAR